MARTYVAVIEDDLSGEVIEAGRAETIEFSVNGKGYTIDLGPAHAAAFHASIEKYIGAATKITPDRGAKPTRRGDQDLGAIRAWAGQHGHTIAARGRISADVLAAYAQAH